MSLHPTGMDIDLDEPGATSPARPRSATVIYHGSLPPPPDERKALLLRLGKALKSEAVPSSFWACLQVADLAALATFVAEAEAAPRLCEMVADNLYALPRFWQQKPPRDNTSRSSSMSSSSRESNISDTARRSMSAKNIVKVRDGGFCVISGRPKPQVCHIFPRYLLKKKQPTDLTRSIPDLWKLLALFFDNEHVLQWRHAIFPDPNKPTDSIPENLICLSQIVHVDWTDGFCGLKPLHLSADGRQLEIEFHWFPREPHGPVDKVDLTRSPSSSTGLDGSDGRFIHGSDNQRVKTGDIFILKTHNPDTHPLPSFAMLEMAWKLNRIVALSAAAQDPELEDVDEEDDNDDNLPMTYNKEYMEEWMAELSEDDDDNALPDSDDRRVSLSSASSAQSPVKTRTNAELESASEPLDTIHES